MKEILSIILLAVFPVFSMAGDKEDKIRQLMEAQGLLSMFESQLEMGKVQSEKVGKQMMDQLLSQINPNEEFQARFSAAFNNYMGKVTAPWGADEIVSVWGQYYGQHFTEKELDSLVDFYTSSIGQKEVKASKKALTEFTVHFQNLSEPIFQKATQDYIQELKLVARECNCQK
ncbi:hypothetical protein R50072_28260 [Simiduia litorea]|uniref:DUF2059 domain-containing protein n=1 Tax=Simiduia litorea TaxID=1435348 RepID=UPI0036F32EB7